ncbi:uncharacterized protein JN550_008040 [Neoarthrinium moseri]|uniref:uncharacterized protein n=1 Tax=Neoarthrinium moseri TaxID=1658444 RepID=UPI001FDC283D|nr:uncharacterized protein JN550_008040 [Neoarthrinium moseri]KAI1866062.1 hypothetical protein JN550_008040 [Neoarthrinium moseri]
MSVPPCARCRPSAASGHLRRLLRGPRSSLSPWQRRSQSSSSSPSEASATDASATEASTTTDQPEREPRTIFSGIQPTGVPHLGNYLGAMRQWRELQAEAHPEDRLLFSIVDLHAITMPQDARQLRQRSREMLAALIAIGLDPKRCTLFYQSAVPAHSELLWILSCTSSMGYLGRMTQWKSKLTENNNRMSLDDDALASKLKLGLFSYPVLQAADILVHRATHVPVGDDQRQHLEFARECATNFNAAFKNGRLLAPETITTETPRVMSLQNPLSKMSKSSPSHKSRIEITSEPAEIRARLRCAVTDSDNWVTYDPARRPGVANLLELWAQCDPARRSPAALAEDLHGATLGALKRQAAEAIIAELDGVRDRYREALQRKGGKWLDEVAHEGAFRARQSARRTMLMVRDVVGLSYRRRGPMTQVK